MGQRSFWTISFILVLAACTKAPSSGDVLAGSKGDGVLYATTECVSPHPDGQQCNKKTCKKDDESDCTDFAKKCVENGHWYAGSNDAGSCSRIL